MKRPIHLPEFSDPPLDEVVLGVQFAPVPGYTSVEAKGVWELYRGEFPKIQEQPLLQPQFETFGGLNLQPTFQFQVGAAPIGSRLWFISETENHLLQFQSDRFLVNWRKSPNPQPYPRFDGIAESFKEKLHVLTTHFQNEFDYSIDVNQAEVTYINIVPVQEFSDIGRWFSIWSGKPFEMEGLSANFNQVMIGSNGAPYARLFHAIQSVYTVDGKHRAFSLSLTFRGKPERNDIDSAMKFFAAGREAIVMRFAEITTKEAHSIWGLK